jgi:hypothetical protein
MHKFQYKLIILNFLTYTKFAHDRKNLLLLLLLIIV